MLDPEHIPSFQVPFHSDTVGRTGNSEFRRLRQELKASLCYVVSFRIAYQNKNLNTPPKDFPHLPTSLSGVRFFPKVSACEGSMLNTEVCLKYVEKKACLGVCFIVVICLLRFDASFAL